MIGEDIEQAPPPVKLTLWPLWSEQWSPNSSLVEKESQVDLHFLCWFLSGLQQPYWLSPSLSPGLLFEYSKKYVDSPRLIPAALWRHSSGSLKTGTLTVNTGLALFTLAPLQIGGQASNTFLLLQNKLWALEQQKDLRSDVTNWHLLFIGKARPPFGPSQTICLERVAQVRQWHQAAGGRDRTTKPLVCGPIGTRSVAPNTAGSPWSVS